MAKNPRPAKTHSVVVTELRCAGNDAAALQVLMWLVTNCCINEDSVVDRWLQEGIACRGLYLRVSDSVKLCVSVCLEHPLDELVCDAGLALSIRAHHAASLLLIQV